MSSASPGPIWCKAMSENRFTFCLLRAATVVLSGVLSVGVWQRAQPTSVKRWRPLAIENDEAPGKLVTGVGAARKRWKLAKLTIAGSARTLGVTSLGTVAVWQPGVSSRSCWNASLVIPISTLYASPEKIRSDLF